MWPPTDETAIAVDGGPGELVDAGAVDGALTFGGAGFPRLVWAAGGDELAGEGHGCPVRRLRRIQDAAEHGGGRILRRGACNGSSL